MDDDSWGRRTPDILGAMVDAGTKTAAAAVVAAAVTVLATVAKAEAALGAVAGETPLKELEKVWPK